jgi:hypothetical protein
MNTDAAFIPRQCPACGQVNPAEAAQCKHCRAPLSPPPHESAQPPSVPLEDFSLPRLPGGKRSRLPLYTGAMLIGFTALIGLATGGWGLVVLPALVPVFVRLYRLASAPGNPFRRPPKAGAAAAQAAGFALTILFTVGIVFAVVLAPFRVASGFSWSPDALQLGFPLAVFVGGFVLALAAASGAAYFLVRRLFPPDEKE